MKRINETVKWKEKYWSKPLNRMVLISLLSLAPSQTYDSIQLLNYDEFQYMQLKTNQVSNNVCGNIAV